MASVARSLHCSTVQRLRSDHQFTTTTTARTTTGSGAGATSRADGASTGDVGSAGTSTAEYGVGAGECKLLSDIINRLCRRPLCARERMRRARVRRAIAEVQQPVATAPCTYRNCALLT
jgi:hypothetical protein